MSESSIRFDQEKFVQSFGQHLIALCVTFLERGKSDPLPKFVAYACTLLEVDGCTFLLTAGHILRELQEAIKSDEIELRETVLADTFGTNRTCDLPIPFDLKSADLFFIDDDEGLDFGLILMRPYYLRLLNANGIVAIREINWKHQHTIKYDMYLMMGFPAEFTSEYIDVRGQAQVGVTMFGVRRLDEPPLDLPAKRSPRFVGELLPQFPLSSVKGMSGGPILGFNTTPPIRYWIVALQSTWLRERRLVFGCPLPTLAALITDRLRNAQVEADLSE
jgi:hypothetical protein